MVIDGGYKRNWQCSQDFNSTPPSLPSQKKKPVAANIRKMNTILLKIDFHSWNYNHISKKSPF